LVFKANNTVLGSMYNFMPNYASIISVKGGLRGGGETTHR